MASGQPTEDFSTAMTSFYEALALKALVQHAPNMNEQDTHGSDEEIPDSEDGSGTSAGEDTQVTQQQPNDRFATRTRLHVPERANAKWCAFLDALCVLCWFEQGGESVVSIAAHDRNGTTTFVLTTNGSSILEPVEHLRNIIRWLHELLGGELQQDDALDTIARRSVELAKGKILNYRSRLRSQCKQIQDQCDCTFLGRMLQDVLQGTTFDRQRLCRAAYDFRGSTDDHFLSAKAKSEVKVWRIMRHYIGRLGSYHAASATVVNSVYDFAGSLRNATVKWIEPSATLHRATGFRLAYDIPQLIAKVCPQLSHFAGRREEVTLRLAGAESLMRKYRNEKQTPVVHAEAAMAYHFHIKHLSFVRDVRYIGCSKPSCYCCDLYCANLPLDLIRRPCSGNAWIRWDLPRRKGDHPREAREHWRIVHNMLDAIYQDIDKDIDGKRYGMKAEFDSTTGMTLR